MTTAAEKNKHISDLVICILTHLAQEIFTGLSVAHQDSEHDFEDLLTLSLSPGCLQCWIWTYVTQTTVTPDLTLVVVTHSNPASIYVESPNEEAERSSQRRKWKIKFFIYNKQLIMILYVPDGWSAWGCSWWLFQTSVPGWWHHSRCSCLQEGCRCEQLGLLWLFWVEMAADDHEKK